jgi:hypothetical protein
MGTMRRPPAVPAAAPGSPEASSAGPENPGGPDRPGSGRPRSEPPKSGRPRSGPAVALHRARTVLGWSAAIWLVLVYLSIPDLRPGLRSVLGLGYLLLLWFFVARTKTLSWASLGALFAIGLPWALVVALLTRILAEGPGQVAVDDLGARTALAAVAEPSLILLPVLVLTVLAPTRVRGFSVADWLLTGLVGGLAFQAVEELARLRGAHAEYGPGLLSGGSSLLPHAGFAGRPVLAALIGVTIGFGVAGWRHGGKPQLHPAARIAWRVLAVLAPLGCWWAVVSVQAGWNATLAVGDRWLTTDAPSMPWLLRLGWRLGQHGFGLGWLLLLLLLIALLVDAGRLRNAAELAEDPLPYPFAPTLAADQWAGRLTRWAGTRSTLPVAAAVWLIAAGAAVVAYAVRDLVVVLLGYARAARPSAHHRAGRRPSRRAGHRPDRRPGRSAAADSVPEPAISASAISGSAISGSVPGDREPGTGPGIREPRWTAIARGCAAGVMVRTIRAEAIALAAGPDTPIARRATRVAGGIGLLGVLLAVFWLGPHWAGGIGDSVTAGPGGPVGSAGAGSGPAAGLAGTVAALGPWWSALAVWQYAVVGVGFVALMVFSAGPLDLPGAGGRSVWFAVRRPSGDRLIDQARSYLALSSPTELAVDGTGAVLGFVPAAVAGPRTGKQVRGAVQQFVAGPQTFIADRRAAARYAAEPPTEPIAIITVRSRTVELPPVKLADGRLLSALTEDDERLFLGELDELARDLARDAARDRTVNAQYRARIYGDEERLISLRPEKWSDGQNPAYGMVADTVYYDGRGESWYLPDTLPESIRHKAHLELDRRLIEFATVVYYPASPYRALEITTNHPLVAQALEERMSRLAIPGYVVLVP